MVTDKNTIGIKLFVLSIFVLLSSSIVNAYIVDPDSIGFGGQTRIDNGKNMTNQLLTNNATLLISFGGKTYLVAPWYNNADNTSYTNLHNFQNGSWTKSNESFPVVTDELTRAAYLFALYLNNDTVADATINTFRYINDTGNTYTNGHIGGVDMEWSFRVNYSIGWGIYKDQVADTAADAGAYAILTLAHINKSGEYNSTNSNNAGSFVTQLCQQFANNSYYDASALTLKNRVNPGQTIRYVPCGGSNVCSSLTNSDLIYQAYDGPMIEAMAACRTVVGDTGTFNYTQIAEDQNQMRLVVANWTGATAPIGLGRAYKLANASSGGTPYGNCTNSCTNSSGAILGTEDPDSMRGPDYIRALWVWKNVTGHELENSTLAAQKYSSITCLTNTSFGYKTDFYGVSYGTCADSGFKAVGLGMPLFMIYNYTQFVSLIDTYNSHYSCTGSSCVMDSQAAFGIYDKSFGLTTAAYAYGIPFAMFSGSGGGGGSSGSNGPINITVHTPVNGSVSTINSILFNATVWNNNNTDVLNVTAGSLPETIYNSTFSSTPASDGWTLNSWTWTSNGGGVINNTADSGSAAWTQNLSLGQKCRLGCNITLNMSVSNFTNAKIFFGTNSGTQDGDRILLERNGNSVNVKHDGGAFSSFTIPMKQYVTLIIYVNLTSGNVTVSSGGSSWNNVLANNHLTFNGSYLSFVPGQNMSGNQNSTGWNISSINVTNLGTPYNITTTAEGNSSMNVTFLWTNGTIIYQQNNTLNHTDVVYTITNQATGNYTWYVNVQSKDNNVNYTGLVYGVMLPTQCANDHGGADWNIATDTNASGYHCNINHFFISPGATLGIEAYNGSNNTGWLYVNATTTTNNGTITGDGRGHGGGAGGGGGGGGGIGGGIQGYGGIGGNQTNQNGTNGTNGLGGASTNNGAASGAGGTGSPGQPGGASAPGTGTAGDAGSSAGPNFDNTTAINASMGFGGGGGAGGGGAAATGGPSMSGNGGAGGGSGADGGGYLIIATGTISGNGTYNFRSGQLTCSAATNGGVAQPSPAQGGNGGNGSTNTLANCAATSGGGWPIAGGAGGGGSGGMIVIAANTINLGLASMNVSGTSGSTNGGTIKLLGSTIVPPSMAGYSSYVTNITYSVRLNVTNIVNNTALTNYTFSISGPVSVNGTSPTNGIVYLSQNGTYNISITNIGPSTYYDANATFTITSSNTTVNVTTYQSLLNVSAYRLFLNTSITGFNVTNGLSTSTTVASSILVPANNGTNTITASVAGNYSKNTTCTASAPLTTSYCNVTGVYDSLLLLDTNNRVTSLNNVSIAIENTTLGGALYNQTMSGANYFPMLQGYAYNVSANKTNYQRNSTLLVADEALEVLNLTLSPSGIYLIFRDENNRSLLPGINISVAVIDATGTETLFYTTNSTLELIGAFSPGEYTFRYGAVGYSLRDFYVTVTEGNTNITMYLLIEDLYTPGTVQVRTFDGIPLEGAVVRLIKYYGDPDVPAEVQDGTTNADGQTTFVAEVVTSFYTWEVEYNGILRFQSNVPELLVVDDTGLWSKTFILNMTNLDRYNRYSGFLVSFTPTNSTLFNGTLYNFTVNVTSDIWEITECTFTIYNNSNNVVMAGPYDTFCSADGGIGSIPYTVPSYNTRLRSEVTITTDEFVNTYSTIYQITTYGSGDGNFTLKNLTDDLTNFNGSGFGGFSRFLISIVAIVMITVMVSRKTVLLGSPAETLLLIFALTLGFSIINWLYIPGDFPIPAFNQWAMSVIIGLLTLASYLTKTEATR